jgi:HK97 family phage prohead protease
MPVPIIDRIPDSYDTCAFDVVETRAEAEAGTFTGLASFFWAIDDRGTVFSPKAFKHTISRKGDRLPVLWMHDPKEMIGPVRSIREDRQGLSHESLAVDDGRTGSYVLAHMRNGNHLGMSFGFNRKNDRQGTPNDPIDFSTWPDQFKGMKPEDVRVITEVELFEISVLPWTFAANPKADISGVRSRANPIAILSTTLEAIRAGTATDAERALAEEIVAALGAPGLAGIDQTPTAVPARRDYAREFAYLAIELGAEAA